jgi:hypothetical protein
VSGSGDAPVESLQRDSSSAARQLDAVNHLSDCAGAGEFLRVLGYEQNALLITDILGERQ